VEFGTPSAKENCVRHSPVGAKRHSQKNMRGCHDPAGVRVVGRRETRVEVLISERSPVSDRHNRNRALPISGLSRIAAIPSQARPLPDQGGRAFSAWVKTRRAKTRSSPPPEPDVDPLYLFMCGLSWRRYSNTSAGWELVRCLRSSGETARIAGAFLAQAENVPARALVRASHDPVKPSPQSAVGLPVSARRCL
jgi:hypothetical protein